MNTFGVRDAGRVSGPGAFKSVPGVDVPAGRIFMPAYSTSPQFGVADRPVAKGKTGAFWTSGVYAFEKPQDWSSSPGQTVYWKPTSAVDGTLAATASTGAVAIGFEVVQPDVPDSLIYVDLARPTGLET